MQQGPQDNTDTVSTAIVTRAGTPNTNRFSITPRDIILPLASVGATAASAYFSSVTTPARLVATGIVSTGYVFGADQLARTIMNHRASISTFGQAAVQKGKQLFQSGIDILSRKRKNHPENAQPDAKRARAEEAGELEKAILEDEQAVVAYWEAYDEALAGNNDISAMAIADEARVMFDAAGTGLNPQTNADFERFKAALNVGTSAPASAGEEEEEENEAQAQYEAVLRFEEAMLRAQAALLEAPLVVIESDLLDDESLVAAMFSVEGTSINSPSASEDVVTPAPTSVGEEEEEENVAQAESAPAPQPVPQASAQQDAQPVASGAIAAPQARRRVAISSRRKNPRGGK